MTKITNSQRESRTPTTKFENVVGSSTPATQTTSNIFFLMPPLVRDPVPANYVAIDDLVSEFEGDVEARVALERGRRWVAETFYANDGETVRTLRLRKGWSQAQLADALATSQSHIARIERGTENLTISTCRRLCKALDIDMNTLDNSLQQQEEMAHFKALGE